MIDKLYKSFYKYKCIVNILGKVLKYIISISFKEYIINSSIHLLSNWLNNRILLEFIL